MRAGQLRHRVTIQPPTRTPSTRTGAVAVSFEDLRSVWARIRPLTAREVQQYARTDHVLTHEVTTRYTPDITADCQLVFDGRTFKVVGVRNIEEYGAELRILAAEVQ